MRPIFRMHHSRNEGNSATTAHNSQWAVRADLAHCRREATGKSYDKQDYWTETVTPFWLLFPPIETCIGRFPDGAFGGIWTLICITPETKPGASP